MAHRKQDRFDLSKMVSSQLSQSIVGKKVTVSPRPDASTKNLNVDWKYQQQDDAVKSILRTANAAIKPIPLEAFQPLEVVQPVIKSVDGKLGKHKKNSSKMVLKTPNFSYLGIPRYNGQRHSIPQMKAAREMKAMQGVRRPSTLMAYDRTREVVRQKRMLQDMLHEHKKLQRDRATVTAEMQAMKSYLAQIKKRLDMSLRKLNIAVDPFESQAKLRKN